MKHPRTWKLGAFELDLSHLPTGDSALADIEKAEIAWRKTKASGKSGFYALSVDNGLLDRMKDLGTALRRDFAGALCIGIGGSYLGPAAIQQALYSPDSQQRFPLHWLSNIDAHATLAAKDFASRRKVATVIISKSGGTLETLAGFFHLDRLLDSAGYVVITDPKQGELRRLAIAGQWRSLAIPPNIGGRFSVLTSVGLFPASLMGLNARAMLEGAVEMRTFLEKSSPAENPAYHLAHALFSLDQSGQKIQILMPYHSGLELFSRWYVQLWAESLGKMNAKGTPVGATPFAALGTTDQHSLLQLFKEGPRDKVIGFLTADTRSSPIDKPRFSVSESHQYFLGKTLSDITNSASRATQTSLRESNVPTYHIHLPRLDENTLGALFFFFEMATAFAAELYQVDAFNQPGVEDAKRLWRDSLE